MKMIALFCLVALISCKNDVIIQKIEVEKTTKHLTNKENKEEINRRRVEMGLPPYPTLLNALPFFPVYYTTAKRGDIYYNHIGVNEALAVNVDGYIIQTFEGVRDSSQLFYRRLKLTDNGELYLYPCSKDGSILDSAELYQYWKY